MRIALLSLLLPLVVAACGEKPVVVKAPPGTTVTVPDTDRPVEVVPQKP